MRLSLAFAAAIVAFPVVSQDLSDEQIRDIFLRQRDAFRAARMGDVGATRGLEMITIEDLATQPDVSQAEPGSSSDGPATDIAETAVPTGDSGVTVTGNAGQVQQTGAMPADEAPVVPVVYGDLPHELTYEMQVTFGFDSATIGEDQVPKLAHLCSIMKTSGIHLFRIIGHTDSAGADAYNERLSLLRAQEVKRYFVNDCGMSPESLETIGLGERFLSMPEDSRAPQNRRVEFQALL